MDDMRWADLVVTMGCGDECPYVPGKRYIDWELPDPAGQPPAAVRASATRSAGGWQISLSSSSADRSGATRAPPRRAPHVPGRR